MCGRFTLIRSGAEVAKALGLSQPPDLQPRYNVAPTQQVFVVRQVQESREGTLFRWGLTPPYFSARKPLFNARAETVASKIAFRTAFRQRRCLIPATGFYEWKTEGKKKTPHLFTVAGDLFAIAGLWEEGGGLVESTCLLTTQANDVVGNVHERMPVILQPEAWSAWLDPMSDLPALQELLRPYPAELMRTLVVGDFVNSARNDGPMCVEPAGQAELVQRSLF